MTATAAQLAAYVQADATDAFVADCLSRAADMIKHRTGTVEVPGPVLDLAVLEVGADLYHRRSARNGVAVFGDTDLAPVRVARDPMRAADDILRPYLGPGFA